MWGIQFREARNSLICANAIFEVRNRDKPDELYRTGMGPDGWWIDRQDDKGEWVRVSGHAETKDIEAILPNAADFGMDWTYRDFLLALTFFGEGYERGYYQGEYRATRRRPAPAPISGGDSGESEEE